MEKIVFPAISNICCNFSVYLASILDSGFPQLVLEFWGMEFPRIFLESKHRIDWLFDDNSSGSRSNGWKSHLHPIYLISTKRWSRCSHLKYQLRMPCFPPMFQTLFCFLVICNKKPMCHMREKSLREWAAEIPCSNSNENCGARWQSLNKLMSSSWRQFTIKVTGLIRGSCSNENSWILQWLQKENANFSSKFQLKLLKAKTINHLLDMIN